MRIGEDRLDWVILSEVGVVMFGQSINLFKIKEDKYNLKIRDSNCKLSS